jgi:hypothetical protein
MNASDNRFYREPGIGDNQPPVDYNDPDILQARLEREYADMLARFAELELGAAKVPIKIATDSEARSVVDWVAQQCKTLITQAERAHTKEKAPYLAGGRTVDRFFNDRIKRLNNTIGPIQRRVQTYFDLKKAEIRRREDAERREAERRRQVALEEAQRLAREAAAREQLGDRRGAINLAKAARDQEDNAAVAEAQAGAPPAPVHIHGEYGATAFAREVWTYEVMDPAAVPLGYLTIDDAAVKGAIRDGIREIPGIRIYQDERFTIKRC